MGDAGADALSRTAVDEAVATASAGAAAAAAAEAAAEADGTEPTEEELIEPARD